MSRTSVAFLWHMHQPDYGLPGQNLNLLPWVRLHATKAYYDLPWLLAQFPSVKAVINLSGSLLAQLSAYASGDLRDAWWDLTEVDPAEMDRPGKLFLLQNFFSIHWDRHVRAMPGFARLLAKRGPAADPAKVDSWAGQDLLDLQVLFNLAWMGFAAREESALVRDLLAKGSGFEPDEKRALLDEQMRILRLLIPLYRELAESGQIELTTTPLYHPILPLVIDTEAARRCAPGRPVPQRFHWPEDAAWHVREAARLFEDLFGHGPVGMWPAEGSVSPEVVPLFADAGVRWIASDEDVLMASSPRSQNRDQALYQPYTASHGGADIDIVFRDHTISDLIGFTYAHNPPDEAAGDLVGRLEDAGDKAPDGGLVSIILDGENPWEAYEEDGRPFLTALFRRLAESQRVETVLPKDRFQASRPTSRLQHLHSGSWILGNYQIWIGAEETNRAWNLLGQARAFLAQAATADPDAELGDAWRSMYAAEGSDWFWWFGDDFACEHKAEFDNLFRAHLRGVYTGCGKEAPAEFHIPVAGGGGDHAGITPPRTFITPKLDGTAANFFGWAGAGNYEPRAGAGAMFRSHRYVEGIRFGFDKTRLFIRILPDVDLSNGDAHDIEVQVRLRTWSDAGEMHRYAVKIPLADVNSAVFVHPADGANTRLPDVAFGRVLEFALPFVLLGARPGQKVDFVVGLVRQGIEFVRHPPSSHITLRVPDDSFEQDNWVV